MTDRAGGTGPNAEQIAAVFRTLAEDHVTRRKDLSPERLWDRLPTRIRSQRPRRGWALSLAAAACVLAVVSTWLLARTGPDELRYTVNGGRTAGGRVYTDGSSALLAFSDGTEVQLAPKTAIEVSVVGEHAALTRLTSGKLSADVEHFRTTDYRFLAGPYEVRVIGTRFELEWQPAGDRLSLVVSEGRVAVKDAKQTERFVSAGQSLLLGASVASAPSDPSAPAQAKTPPATASGVDPSALAAAGSPALVAADGAEPARAGPDHNTRSSAESWTELVQRGSFEQIVRAAEHRGIQATLQAGTPADLKALAQAATYTRRANLAERSWLAVRTRFPRTPAASTAAFFLARLYEQQGQPERALRLLDEYLKGSGSGGFAQEALGRKLSLVARLRGPSAARPLARDYLAKYPNGAYSSSARELVR